MARLMKKEGIGKYFVDMCQFNLRLAEGALVRKPTIIMTNSTIIGKYLSRRCDGSHVHGQLKGGTRCRQAATYTAEFCEAIVEAYKLHRRKIRRDRRQGSLLERDTMDSHLCVVEIGKDDPEDQHGLDLIGELSDGTNTLDHPGMSFNLWPFVGEGPGVDCANIMSDVNVLDGAIFESMDCEDAE